MWYINIDIFVNCDWVDTRWQWYIAHLHTNNTQNNTVNNKTIRITNKTTQTTNLGECWPCPVFVSFTLAFAFTTERKARKNLSPGSRKDSQYADYQDTHTYTHTHTHDVVYSQCCHQHVSAAIPATYRVMSLLQEYRRTNVFNCVTVTP
jgi:hypothetical protein